jgi:hypothetical protein
MLRTVEFDRHVLLGGLHQPGLLAFFEQLGVGQAEPGDGPLAGADEQQLGNDARAAVTAAPVRSSPRRHAAWVSASNCAASAAAR